MRDPEQTIGNQAMLPPRKREGIREFFFTTNTSSMRVNAMLRGTVEVLEDTESKEFFSCFFLFIDKTDDIK